MIIIKIAGKEVIIEHLNRSRSRICENGIFDLKMIDSVEGLLQKYDTYFNSIEPIPFLDDMTTKNVLIHKGKLSGLIDIDNVCFGDKLYVVALTNMALIDKGFNTNYIDYWTEELNITPDERHILDFYTLIFCLDFMSEKGMQFNKTAPMKISDAEILKLKNIFARLYEQVI